MPSAKQVSEAEKALQKAAGVLKSDESLRAAPQEAVEAPFDQRGISEEDKQAFLRALLSGESFVKRYPLFRNNVVVEFGTCRESELSRLRQTALGKYEHRSTEYNQLYTLLRFQSSVRYLSVGQKALADLTPADGGDPLYLSAKDLADLDNVVYRALFKEFIRFEELCDVLYEIAADPNF